MTGRIAVALAIVALGTSGTADAKKVTPRAGLTMKQLVDLTIVKGTVMAPDGRHVAVLVAEPRSPEEKPGASHHSIWLLRVGDKTLRRFTRVKAPVHGAGFTPDSSQLTFVAARHKKKSQVWALRLDGGEATALTDAEHGVQAYAFSPDGTRIAYTTLADKEPKRAKKARSGYDANVVDSHFRHHLLVIVDLASGKKLTVSPETKTAYDFSWSPDGKSLAVMMAASPRNDDNYMFRSLWRFPAVAAARGKMLVEGAGKMGGPKWSPDGRWIAWLGAQQLHDATTGTLWAVPASGGERVAVNRDAEETAYHFEWRTPTSMLVVAVVGTRSVLTERAFQKKGETRVIVSGGPIFTRASYDKTRDHFALVGTTPTHPGEAFLGRVSKPGVRRATHHNPALKTVRMATQEVIEWKASDGKRIEGILVKPLGWKKGKRYPLVVLVHGGPEWQELNGWNSRYLGADQVLAARGYAVLRPNYRGSAGRGAAFAMADHKDLGGKEFQDILDGIEHLHKAGLVERGKVAMMGGSYGGYMSALAATKGTAHFAAAINFAGISNWTSFMGTSDIPHEMSLVHWNLYCFDQPTRCWEASPLRYLAQARTPLMVVHGAKDKRVPIGQAWEIYTAFKYKKIPTELVIYPREGHGLRERAHQLDFIERTIQWFDRHVRGRKVSGPGAG